MASKRSALALAIGLSASAVGCQGMFVPKDQYDRDVAQLKEYIAALERDNAEIRPKAEAFDRLKAEFDLSSDANKFYGELAESLKRALAGLGVAPTEVEVAADGRVIFATDVLFDLGSWSLSARGREIIAKFASTQKGNVLKVVGHTDRKPIVRAETKKALDTDTNLELSVKRAVAVAGELIKGGLSERHLWVEGKGSAEPRSGGDAKCRRVEIFVVPGAEPAVAPTSARKSVRK
jgi:flagellar motor protein MotB